MLENKPLGVELYRHAPGDDSRGGMRKRIQRFCFLRECFRLQRFWLWLWAQMGVTRRAWTRTASTSTSPVRTLMLTHLSFARRVSATDVCGGLRAGDPANAGVIAELRPQLLAYIKL